MNGDIFVHYLNDTLFSALERAYPNRKVLLVMDNASYHKVKIKGSKSAHSMTKKELSTFIEEHGGTVPEKSTVITLREIAFEIYDNMSTLVQKESMAQGYETVYLPPRQPQLNPVKLFGLK